VLEAAVRADQVLEDGDMASAATWHRILDATKRLTAEMSAEGELIH